MSERKPLLFKHRDVERAAIAAATAVLKVNRIEIAPDGSIRLSVSDGQSPEGDLGRARRHELDRAIDELHFSGAANDSA
jgi:hypothetical protein